MWEEEETKEHCTSQPCARDALWNAGHYADCDKESCPTTRGDITSGYLYRDVKCVLSDGKSQLMSSACDSATKPASWAKSTMGRERVCSNEALDPCLGRGSCIDGACSCAAGYSGSLCQV